MNHSLSNQILQHAILPHASPLRLAFDVTATYTDNMASKVASLTKMLLLEYD